MAAHPTRRELTPERVAWAVDRYAAGDPIGDLVEDLEVTRAELTQALKDAGFVIRRGGSARRRTPRVATDAPPVRWVRVGMIKRPAR